MLLRRVAFIASLLFLIAVISGAVVRREEAGTQATAPVPAVAPAVAAPVVKAQIPGEREVKARVGDVVSIDVRTHEPADVGIVDLGVSGLASADVPATLEFVADAAGRFPVVVEDSGRRLGTVVVDRPSG